MHENFSYAGFSYEYNIFRSFFSILLISTISFLLPVKYKKTSDFLLNIHFIMPVIPMFVLFSVGKGNVWFVSFLSLCFVYIVFLSRVKIRNVKVKKLNENKMLWLLLTFSMLIIFVIVAMGGYRYINFDITKVYQYRAVAANNLPNIFGYINPWVSKIIIPICLVIAIRNKQYFFAIISILFSVSMFALTHHKSILIMPFFVLVMYIILSVKENIRILQIGMLSLILFPLITYNLNVFGELSNLFNSFVLRRVFFVPANLNLEYYNFFSNNQFMYWSDSRITFNLLDSPYSMSIPYLIAYNQFGEVDMAANTGWIGAGYANAGYVGMILYASLVGLIFSILNSLDKKLGKKLVTAASLPLVFSMITSSDLLTVILTHGLVILFLVLIVLKARRYEVQY
ncbi:O-antigen polymerase [Vibrio sp. HN007]|uniref:O-antigen polymerase n=1 Tax=Vibrio iocasae TaxID=3098914 RepID=UPI0035D4F5CB